MAPIPATRILEARMPDAPPPWPLNVEFPVEHGLTLNEFIEDIKIWRGTQLVTYEARVADELGKIWANAIRDVIGRTTSGPRAISAAQRAALTGMLSQALASLTDKTLVEVQSALIAAARHEALVASEIGSVFNSYRELGGPFNSIPPFQVPPYQALGLALNATDPNWFMRGLFEDYILGEGVTRARGQILSAYLQGQDVFALAGTLERTLKLKGHQAESLARTSISRIANLYRRQVHKDNKAILKGEKYTATLDSTTCPICGNYDGKLYQVGEGPAIPVHENCRCDYIPITKSIAELAGRGGLDEIPYDSLEGQARRSMDGSVPPSTTWGAWLKRKEKVNPGVARKVLGPTRYKAWTRGEITLKDLTWGGHIRTLRNMRRSGLEV